MIAPQNILIIDDVYTNLQTLTEIVRNSGFIARPVINASQAVNAIEAMLPNLILMDISMPDVNGFIFCSVLKKNNVTKEIPVIFISALNSPEVKLRGFHAGAVDFITKPFEAEELILRIKLHLKLYASKTDLEQKNMKLYVMINDQMKRLYESQRNVIYALVNLIEKIKAPKAAFYEHIAKNSKLLAMSLSLSAKYSNIITANFMEAIELTAPLLDIGMLILGEADTENQLSMLPGETVYRKEHTTVGAAFLEDISSSDIQNDFIRLAIDIVKSHHENWDGSGYPEGISGTDIPLCARIVSVVSTFNILINQSWQGETYTLAKTIEYITDRSGYCFDPDIAAVFTKIQSQLKN